MDAPNPPVRVTEYTVSYTFDTHRGGQKSSHFVSMRFSAERPMTPEEAEVAAITSSVTVTRAAVYQALARGAIEIEEANEIISRMKQNHEQLHKKLSERVPSGTSQ